MKKILGCFLLGLLILLSTEKVVTAEQPDFNKKGSISVYMRTTDGTLVPGGNLEVYKVAYVSTATLGDKYVYMSEFKNAGYSLEQKEISGLASDLYNYAVNNNIHGDIYENATGIVKVNDLAAGLYLIDNKTAPESYNRITPFLVSVPFKVADTWVYDVDASPKMSLLTKEAPPSPAPDPNPAPVPNPEPAPELEPETKSGPSPVQKVESGTDSKVESTLKDEPEAEADTNLVKSIKSPATGDINGNILAIIMGTALLCVAYVIYGVYLVPKKKASISESDLVTDDSKSENHESDEIKGPQA